MRELGKYEILSSALALLVLATVTDRYINEHEYRISSLTICSAEVKLCKFQCSCWKHFRVA